MSQKLNLRVHSVKCVDETNGQYIERFGNDEIWLGGYSIASNGDTQTIAPFQVGAGFDDGDVVVLQPPRVMCSFDFGTPGRWQEFGVGLVLIEKDNGGMREAIEKIAAKVQTELKAQIALAPPAGGGTTRSLLFEILKWALPIIAPVVADYVKRKIIAAYNDDIFQPQHATQSVRGPNFSFGGSQGSARKTVVFREHDGLYELVYDWQVTGAGTALG